MKASAQWPATSDALTVALVIGSIATAILFILSGSELRILLAPLYFTSGIAALFWYRLYRQDKIIPLYDIGGVYMLAFLAYAAIPLAWHALSGMQFTVWTHNRLYLLNPTVEEFSEIGWMYGVNMAGFALAYVSLRKGRPVSISHLEKPSSAAIVAIAVLFLSMKAILLLVRLTYGVDFSTAYDESIYEHHLAFLQLPLVGQQLMHQAVGMTIVLNVLVILLVVAHWRSSFWRWVLFIWFGMACTDYILRPGGRFLLFSMFLTLGLGYHRFIKPFSLRTVVFVVVITFVAFMGIGLTRGGSTFFEGGQIVLEDMGGIEDIFAISNEFQNAYGSALEFKHNFELGWLDPIPWQVYCSELLALVPRQFLPFEKIDPVLWYVGLTGNPDYFNYSAITQSIIGFGWVELLVRGLSIGAIVAAIHNWQSRSPFSFWRNVFYVWLVLVLYNAGARNTSLATVPMVLFHFLPVLLAVRLAEWLAGWTRDTRTPMAITERRDLARLGSKASRIV